MTPASWLDNSWIGRAISKGLRESSLDTRARFLPHRLGVARRRLHLLEERLDPHKLSVPAKERLWRDHERGPAVAGQEPTGRREECSVGRAKVRTPDLPAQDAQLVTQDRDLDLLGGDGRTSATASTDQPAEHEIEDGPDHGR